MPIVPWPGDDVGIVVGMHEHGARALLQRERVRVGIAVRVAVQHDLRAARLDRGDLDVRRGHRHRRSSPRSRAVCAASATPCAWLPADAAMTPRARSAAVRCAILL